MKVTHVRSDMTDIVLSDERSFELAMQCFINAHLMWGCSLREITPTKIVVHTPIFSWHDIATFEGSEEEIAQFAALIAIREKAKQEKGQEALIDEMVDRFPEGVTPFMLNAMAPIVKGQVEMNAVREYVKKHHPEIADKLGEAIRND